MILSKTRSDRRDRRLCRFGVMLVICSLLINMVAVPKAKAVVIDATAAFGAAAATAAINGTTATTLFTGMSTSAATTAMTTLMGEYAAATGAAASGTALAGMIGAGTIVTAAGALVLTAAAGYAVYKFIEWLREDKGLEAGGDPVNFGAPTGEAFYNGIPLPDINTVWTNKGTFPYAYILHRTSTDQYIFVAGSVQGYSTDLYFLNVPRPFQTATLIGSQWGSLSLIESPDPTIDMFGDSWGSLVWSSSDLLYEDGSVYFVTSDLVLSRGDEFSLSPYKSFQTIPQELPEGQVIKIDTGIESLSADDQQATADLIMQTAIDGALDPVVTVEADPTVTPEPEPSPDPDAPELPSNLGDLGAALTTRFPFSIPWDIARAIKLIAAPAKAPYWEVDFLAPIAYRLPEGWKGSTKIVLDFGQPEYEIIGIASRWTSTIGFCLALAAATKRFIWTA